MVMGSRHPLQHIRGTALSFLRSTNVDVQLLEAHEDAMQQGTDAHGALNACLEANEVCFCSYRVCHTHSPIDDDSNMQTLQIIMCLLRPWCAVAAAGCAVSAVELCSCDVTRITSCTSRQSGSIILV